MSWIIVFAAGVLVGIGSTVIYSLCMVAADAEERASAAGRRKAA